MMTKVLQCITIALASLLFISCNADDSTDSVGPTNQPSPIGAWTLTLPQSQFVPIATKMNLTIEEIDTDTTYEIDVQQELNSAIGFISMYKSEGTASMTATDVIVTGNECVVFNTETKQLEPQDDGQCGNPIPLTTDKLTETTWAIPGAAVASLPIFSAEQTSIIKVIELPLTRVN